MVTASADLSLWKPVLVIGVLQAGLYGLLPIAFVLSYRVSRTIAFVHGGIAGACGFIYWVLVYDGTFVPGPHPALAPWLGLLLMLILGAVLGGSFGAVVMSRRVARLSLLTLTVISLGTMMILLGVVTKVLMVYPGVMPPGPFGASTVSVAGIVVTSLRLGTFIAVCVLVVILAVILRSSAGKQIQAICDDLDASAWCGINVPRIGMAVYAGSGAIASLAGVLITATVGPDPLALFQVMLRGLAVAIIGGMVSFPLALTGALVVGVLESALVTGMLGDIGLGRQELVINCTLLVLILLIARARKVASPVLERRAL
ncbi:MAG: hypothetical protein JWN36_2535 [Microbacteriaceae bacterium]|jgi:branched-chain amino acid transport system permease protein|nr:hypothetical protein [Microbacteriaceae bacterium]